MASKQSKDAANLICFMVSFLVEIFVLLFAWVKSIGEE